MVPAPETFRNHYLSYEDDYIMMEAGMAFLNTEASLTWFPFRIEGGCVEFHHIFSP